MARHLPVHHPAGGHDVDPGLGLGDGDGGVALEGGVVVDAHRSGGEDPAVAVVGVLVEAVVGHEHEPVADLVPQVARAATWTTPSGSSPPEPRASLRAGTPKRMTAGTPRSASARTSLRRLSWVCWTHPRHRRDRLRVVDPLLHEQGGDEVVDRQPGLGHQPPDGRRAPQAPEAAARGIPRMKMLLLHDRLGDGGIDRGHRRLPPDPGVAAEFEGEDLLRGPGQQDLNVVKAAGDDRIAVGWFSTAG